VPALFPPPSHQLRLHLPLPLVSASGLNDLRRAISNPRFHHHRNGAKESTSNQTASNMSSPSHRRQRSSQSATPRRSARQSEAAGTPRQSSQLASSPLFYQSSPAPSGSAQHNGAAEEVSSPLRQMTDSQDTHGNGATPSSPLRQMTGSQTPTHDPQRTPRASGGLTGGTRCNWLSVSHATALLICFRIVADSI